MPLTFTRNGHLTPSKEILSNEKELTKFFVDMSMNKFHNYSPEEIEVVNYIEELQHFQRLIDIGENECRTFNESPDFELKQYYQKRQKIYQNLLDSLLKLQFRTPKMNEILKKLLEKHDIQLPQKKSSPIDKDLEQGAVLLE